jgi:lipoprotein LprG
MLPRMRIRRLLVGPAALLAVVAGITGGCSSTSDSAPLPDAAGLLNDAASTTKAITSAHFSLMVNGTISGLPVTQADGDLTRDGKARGTAKLREFGQLLEVNFVVAGKQFYLKGPTGGFEKLPGGTGIYDPAAILDPDRGVAKVITTLSNPKTEGTDDVGGVATYRVSGKATKDTVSTLVPGVTSDVDVKLWLRQDAPHQPVKAEITVPGGASVDVTLSDVDKPVTITPPQ